MTMMNGEPDYEEDGEELYCDSCGEELLADGSCPMCDDDDDEFEDDLESEDSIEALIDMEDRLDE